MKKTDLTDIQAAALKMIALTGDAGLDFYWYPARGKRVLINGNCERALIRAGAITSEWRKGPNGERGSEYFGQSIKFARLTVAGRALVAKYLS